MRNKYSISEFFSTGYALLLTKLTYKQARLLRRPIYIRGRKSIVGGNGLTTGHFCRFDLDGCRKTLFIGDNCRMGDNVHVAAYERVEIGDNVLMASKVFISDTEHGVYKGLVNEQDSPGIPPNDRKLVTNPTKIGSNVWIGENVVILSGVTIGDGCIIGANSVVTKNISSNCIAVGSPARVVKKWNKTLKSWECQ